LKLTQKGSTSKASLLSDSSQLKDELKRNESIKLSIDSSLANAEKQRAVLENILIKILESLLSKLGKAKADVQRTRFENLGSSSLNRMEAVVSPARTRAALQLHGSQAAGQGTRLQGRHSGQEPH
jgi:hypothetical protein